MNAISTKKPVRLSERCGVTRAENSVGWSSGGSKSLPAVIAYQYIRIMAKIIRSISAKKPGAPSVPKKSAKNAAKTHCRAGHPYDAENTYVTKRGRHCRKCNLQRVKEYQGRNGRKDSKK